MPDTQDDARARHPTDTMEFEELARWYAGLTERTSEDMVKAAGRAEALGRTFGALRELAQEVRASLRPHEMAVQRGEILLGHLREALYPAVMAALIDSRIMFRRGEGDEARIIMVASAGPGMKNEDAMLARDENKEPLGVFEGCMLTSVSPIMFARAVNQCADVKKAVSVKRNGRPVTEWMPADFPEATAKSLLSDGNEMTRLPLLRGTAHMPVIDMLGALSEEPGYHEPTCMFIAPTTPKLCHLVPNAPTREDAEAALETLRYVIHTYEFDGPRNLVAGLAGLMTAVLRPSMDKAPLLLSTAGQARTGKDRYLRTCALLAVGSAPTMYGIGDRAEEHEKRLSQILHSASPFVVLNNVNGQLASSDLCSFLSEGSFVVRVFGSTEQGKRAQYAAMWAASGNNLVAKGDLATRCFSVRQVSENPNPGERTFTFDPLVWLSARENREQAAAAVFTIVRWWLLSVESSPLGGANDFDQWSRLVREPLHALTEIDIFQETFANDQEERATEGPGAFNDACGAIFTAAWRLDYPWSQADAERKLERWRRDAGEVVAPPHIQLCEKLSREHAGELSVEEVCARVLAKTPTRFAGTGGAMTTAAQKVRRFLSDLNEDAERGGSEPSASVAEWVDEVQQALQGMGKAAGDVGTAGRQVKKALDVAGGVWRVAVKKDDVGIPMKGGANGTQAVYAWSRVPER